MLLAHTTQEGGTTTGATGSPTSGDGGEGGGRCRGNPHDGVIGNSRWPCCKDPLLFMNNYVRCRHRTSNNKNKDKNRNKNKKVGTPLAATFLRNLASTKHSGGV